MIKFKANTNETLFFKTKSNDTHFFKTRVNDLHTFTIKSLEATIIKQLNFINNFHSKAKIGGRKILLKEFANSSLKDLPITLRQFVGNYVYIKAKMKFVQDTLEMNRVACKIKGKMKPQTTSILSSTLSMIIKLKGACKNLLYTHKTDISCKTKAKAKINDKYSLKINVDGNIPLVAYQDTLLADLPSSLKHITGRYMKIIAKTKFNSNYSNITKIEHEYIKAKLRLNNISNSTCDISSYSVLRCKKLNIYDDTLLKDLPLDFREFCYYTKADTWASVNNTYSSWNDVKEKVNTWDDI